jgi:hypothetical protein
MFTFELVVESIKELGGASPLVQNLGHITMIKKKRKTNG